MPVHPSTKIKLGRKLISLASIVVGLALLGWAIYVNRQYETNMPRELDKPARRTIAMTVRDGTRIFVTEAEGHSYETTQTYLIFGWPFVVLGLLLGVTGNQRRDLIEQGPTADAVWTDRK
ncbi:MAG TPA: hypothetical protein VH560_07865 [Polyangia bacterium]|jgi:hypothetical protein|nr:hypothetical protein [Polyangia bacterium]